MHADSYVFAEAKLNWRTTQNIKTPNAFSTFPSKSACGSRMPSESPCQVESQPPHAAGHQAVQKLLTHETVPSGCETLRKRHLNQICIPLLFWFQNNCNSGLQ